MQSKYLLCMATLRPALCIAHCSSTLQGNPSNLSFMAHLLSLEPPSTLCGLNVTRLVERSRCPR